MSLRLERKLAIDAAIRGIAHPVYNVGFKT